ncbi:MAG: lysophospholipid acyltransferase family protein [Acidimicrobiia bacterium]
METRRRRTLRRLRTVPSYLVLFLVATALLPLLVILALVADFIRRIARGVPLVGVRIVLFGWVYVATGTLALVVLFGQWIGAGFGRFRQRLLEGAARVQEWWARWLFGAVRRLFRLDLEVEGLDAVAPGPVIVMMRHASIIDTLLPNVLLTTGAGLRLRYVLKRELLADPALDIGGNRLINHFVDRSGDSRAEVTAVARLADGLTATEGVLIYPEGTRFSEAKRRQILERATDDADPLLARMKGLKRVLPPRPGGTLALLRSGYDIVIVAHTGLEPLASIPDTWSGRIIGSKLRVRAWRHDAATVPVDRRAQLSWLYDRWEEVDRWLDR